ncbi:MAG: hypothetical protein Q9217_003232 [Psora testacea]
MTTPCPGYSKVYLVHHNAIFIAKASDDENNGTLFTDSNTSGKAFSWTPSSKPAMIEAGKIPTSSTELKSISCVIDSVPRPMDLVEELRGRQWALGVLEQMTRGSLGMVSGSYARNNLEVEKQALEAAREAAGVRQAQKVDKGWPRVPGSQDSLNVEWHDQDKDEGSGECLYNVSGW